MKQKTNRVVGFTIGMVIALLFGDIRENSYTYKSAFMYSPSVTLARDTSLDRWRLGGITIFVIVILNEVDRQRRFSRLMLK